MILLDTDVAIDLLRSYPSALTWLDSLGDEELMLPGLVAMELIQGCRSKIEQDKLQGELGNYFMVWPNHGTLLGHKTMVMTLRYAKTSPTQLRDAIDALDVPLEGSHQQEQG